MTQSEAFKAVFKLTFRRSKRSYHLELWFEDKPVIDGKTGNVLTFNKHDVTACMCGQFNEVARTLSALTREHWS